MFILCFQFFSLIKRNNRNMSQGCQTLSVTKWKGLESPLKLCYIGSVLPLFILQNVGKI
ncbi:hypothetical protein MHA_2394 [Mannheimia haemolytica PHL213]|nr:hypothetical protein MHA_2394 [Mannheimia haemolytica PHL213]